MKNKKKFRGWLWVQTTTALKPVSMYDASVPTQGTVLALATIHHTISRMKREASERKQQTLKSLSQRL